MALRSPRSQQNTAAFLAALLVAMYVGTPTVVALGVDWKNSLVSGGATKEYSHLSLTEVGSAYYVFTNRTNTVQKLNLCPVTCHTPLRGSLADIDAASVGAGSQYGGIEATLDLPNASRTIVNAVAVWGQNASLPGTDSYLELTLNNESAQKFLSNSITGYAYALNPLATGYYVADPIVNATNLVRWHASDSDKDFSLGSSFVYGGVQVFDSGKVDIATGTKAGTNYTRTGSVDLWTEGQAVNDGTDSGTLAPQSDNAVVIRLHGFHAGSTVDGTSGDLVHFSVGYTMPYSATPMNAANAIGLAETAWGLVLIAGAALASPWYSLRGLEAEFGRSTRAPGGR
jgi:hypothetical protein